MSGQRTEFDRIVAFSMDIRSDGNPSFCHIAIVVSSVSKLSASKPSVIGIGGSRLRKFVNHILFIKSKRNCLVKQPTYEMNAVIKSVSPGNVVPCAIKLKISNENELIQKIYLNINEILMCMHISGRKLPYSATACAQRTFSLAKPPTKRFAS